MVRSWPERLAKRVPRLTQTLDKMEDRGRTSDPHYSKILAELAELCEQIIEATEEAKHELSQVRTEATLSRRKLAEERDAFKAERDAFNSMREQTLCALRSGGENLKRQLDEVASERAALAQDRDITEASRRQYEAAVAVFKKGMAGL